MYFDHAWIRQKAKKKIIYFDFCRHKTTISTNNYDKWCMFYAKIYDLIFIYNQPTAFISGCSTLLDWHYWHGHYPSTSYHYFNTSIFFKKFNLYGLKCLSNEHFFFLFTSWNVLYVLSIPRHRNKFRKFSKKTHEKMSLKTRVNHTTEWATIRHLPELWEEGISSRILKSRCVLLSRYSHLYRKPICLCKLKSLNSVVKIR